MMHVVACCLLLVLAVCYVVVAVVFTPIFT